MAHAGTPAIAHLDTLGRTFLTIADNGGAGKYETRVELDLEGNTIVVTDARNNAVMIYAVLAKDDSGQLIKDGGKPRIVGRAFDLLGHNLYSYSMDAGERWMLNNVAGKPIRAWNDRETRYDVAAPPKGHVVRTVYDALQRPTHLYMQATGAAEILVERLVYGEGHPEARQRNLKGKPFQHYDGAGVVSNWEFDFKGNLRRGSRQLAQEYKQSVDWMILAGLTEIVPLVQAAQAQLEPQTFDSATQFDALNRPVQLTTPDNSVIHPGFNEANLLERMEVQLQGSAARSVFVENIDYDAKSQRQGIVYGNGVKTEYSYDSQTLRLVRLVTRRMDAGTPVRLQDLNYTYDPVGNITTIQDRAQQEVFFRNVRVVPVNGYTYDALYCLIEATGREHPGQAVDFSREFKPERKPGYDSNDLTRRELPHPNDVQAMREYTERYQYDAVGNILKLFHAAGEGSWQRDYTYAATNNRLLSTTVPGLPNGVQSSVNYSYDTHGNMTQMPHLLGMQWDFKDQLHQVDLGGGGTAYYVYDAAGQRVRKVVEKSVGLREERIYLGGFEVFRRYNGVGLVLERETLHGMDDQRRIALVETLTFEIKDGRGGRIENPVAMIRCQLDNHLGSAALELDGAGQVISYEEYTPYGTTSYQAGRSVAEVSLKRYRYTGKERDEETGLCYYGARYYAAWLDRWVSCDPDGLRSGINVYAYTSNNPIGRLDSDGKADKPVASTKNESDPRNYPDFNSFANQQPSPIPREVLQAQWDALHPPKVTEKDNISQKGTRNFSRAEPTQNQSRVDSPPRAESQKPDTPKGSDSVVFSNPMEKYGEGRGASGQHSHGLDKEPETKDWESKAAQDMMAPVGTPVRAATDGQIGWVHHDERSEHTGLRFGDQVTIDASNG